MQPTYLLLVPAKFSSAWDTIRANDCEHMGAYLILAEENGAVVTATDVDTSAPQVVPVVRIVGNKCFVDSVSVYTAGSGNAWIEVLDTVAG